MRPVTCKLHNLVTFIEVAKFTTPTPLSFKISFN